MLGWATWDSGFALWLAFGVEFVDAITAFAAER